VQPRSSSVAPTSLKHRSGAIAVVQIAQGPECQSRDERPTHSTGSAGSSRHCADSASRGRNMAPASHIHEIRDGRSFPDDTPHPCLGEQSPPSDSLPDRLDRTRQAGRQALLGGSQRHRSRSAGCQSHRCGHHHLRLRSLCRRTAGPRHHLGREEHSPKEHSETRGAYPSPSCLSPRGAQPNPRQAPDQQNTLCSRLANALDHLGQVLGNL
jgi:hypothetical protein